MDIRCVETCANIIVFSTTKKTPLNLFKRDRIDRVSYETQIKSSANDKCTDSEQEKKVDK